MNETEVQDRARALAVKHDLMCDDNCGNIVPVPGFVEAICEALSAAEQRNQELDEGDAILLPSEVNSLPKRVRSYIHDVETKCDPAGDIRTIGVLRDTVRALEAQIGELEQQNQELQADNERLNKVIAADCYGAMYQAMRNKAEALQQRVSTLERLTKRAIAAIEAAKQGRIVSWKGWLNAADAALSQPTSVNNEQQKLKLLLCQMTRAYEYLARDSDSPAQQMINQAHSLLIGFDEDSETERQAALSQPTPLTCPAHRSTGPMPDCEECRTQQQ
jgi:BMFP domain-containing protein YqiC